MCILALGFGFWRLAFRKGASRRHIITLVLSGRLMRLGGGKLMLPRRIWILFTLLSGTGNRSYNPKEDYLPQVILEEHLLGGGNPEFCGKDDLLD